MTETQIETPAVVRLVSHISSRLRWAHSLTTRLVLVAALGALPILIIAGGFLLWLFAERIQNQFDAFLAAYQQQLIAGLEINGDGTLHLSAVPADPQFDLAFSGWYWEIRTGGRTVAQSESAGPLEDVAAGLAIPAQEGASDAVGPGRIKLRVVARDVRLAGTEKSFRVVVTGPHAQIDREVMEFGVQLCVTLGALGAAFLVATVLQVRYGLSPLRALQSALQEVRSGGSVRLVGDYPIEVAPLADEFNEVLAHNEALIGKARVQAGNLAHGLKTPLTVLRQELSEIEGEHGQIVRDQIAIISDQVDRVLARIRAAGPQSAASGRIALRQILQDLAFSLDLIHRDRAIKIEIECADQVSFVGDAADLAEILGSLMDNACKWAHTRIRVTVVSAARGIVVLVDDDGPGIPLESRGTAMMRGGRLDETRPGHGLGLDIASEIATLYRGALCLEDSPMGGLRARLDLPT
jgi:signal transduction histidine kinase